MKIKLSWYTPRKLEEVLITPEVSPFIKITLGNICLESDVIHVKRKDTMLENVLQNKNVSHEKKGNKRRHHAHAAEDDEPSTKRTRQDSDEEFVLISSLIGTITHGSNDWIIDSGASKHMIGFKESFVKLSEHESPHKVILEMTTNIQ